MRMKQFHIEDKVKIKDVPNEYKNCLNMEGVVISIGGIGYPDDDVMVRLENGKIVCVKEDQLLKLVENT